MKHSEPFRRYSLKTVAVGGPNHDLCRREPGGLAGRNPVRARGSNSHGAGNGSDRDTAFILGRINNGITSSDGETVNASSISAKEMQKYDRASVD